ncbi:GAF and ANTAR domain-containing protein [Streptomyces sp. NPDC050617]|uniref:GAF and ANTAR domain-containing protein n=1 Tax=Streptomyces sp. NPDC050617 TaxID=3154628 RepID=UPI003416B692
MQQWTETMDEQVVAKTFVELADNLDAAFDPLAFLRLLTDRCVGVLGANAAGVLLADRSGELRLMAASDERVRLLELLEVQQSEGPCLDCFRRGAAVSVPDVMAEARRWPRFAPQARHRGVAAVQALPMRCRNETVGTLNLFCADARLIGPVGSPIAQAMADVAAISLVQRRSAQRSAQLNEQLQTALDSRIVIEQAKGKLAERYAIDMERAFNLLRRYARSNNLRLSDVARDVIEGCASLPAPGE